ncbi:MAG: PadR family transcriptional regulator [Acidipropionibacterium sp.]|jgi:DNA-binding PadR family transcriptional regulator|nr:PadR family transcriptional regulator [Acidipropionibacterium sp.]
MQLSKDLVAASATPIVLGVLSRGEDYGYSLLRRIARASDGQLEWSEGMLYPLLHRLEEQSLVASHWGASPEGRRRKYYAITDAGSRELAGHVSQWRLVIATLDALLPPGGSPAATSSGLRG